MKIPCSIRNAVVVPVGKKLGAGRGGGRGSLPGTGRWCQ